MKKNCRNAVTVSAAAGVFLSGSAVLAQDLLNYPEVRDDLTPKDLKRVQRVIRPTDDFSKAERFEVMQGGAGTSRKKINRDAFSNFSANIEFSQELDFKVGNGLFRKFWVSSPSSTQASDGLGPLFNARACQSCHLKDGRGHPPEGDADATSMLIRLARPAQNDEETKALAEFASMNFPDAVYGGQIQDLAVPGLKAEGKIAITYSEQDIELAGGEIVSLRKPDYSIAKLAYGDLQEGVTLSPRIANPMIGLGLIEAIHPSDILKNADPDDENGDGISGKAAVARDPETGKLVLGRFGWKASEPSLKAQNAGAFSGDIGISSPLKPAAHGECTEQQTDCLAMPTGVQKRLGDTEAPDPVLDLVTFYTANLAVPARRGAEEADVLIGKRHFYEIGCVSCHTPKFVTSRKAERKEHKFQLIWPYSDFLLHDMGEGLADNQQVGAATGQEWRTPPLWGIGLTKTVNGHTFFLHDGRARNLKEAVLWHGGEAEAAKTAFAGLAKPNREALIKFLESL